MKLRLQQGRARHSVRAVLRFTQGLPGLRRAEDCAPYLVALVVCLLTGLAAFAETADDFFHGGAVNYLSNNIPKALEVVTNGRALYPDDIKLKKLEELLKQQNQQQQQQQKEQQQKQDEKKDQQSKRDQNEEQKKKDEKKSQKQDGGKEQEKKQDQEQGKQSDDKSKEQPEDKQQQVAAHAMTPQEAQKLLDAQKGDEKVLPFIPQGEPKHRDRTFKDW